MPTVVVASLTKEQMWRPEAAPSLVDLNEYQLSAENCQPLMDTAEYGRATRFKLISDLAEPLYFLSDQYWQDQYRKTILPGYDHSIYVTSALRLFSLKKTPKPVSTVAALR